MTRVRTGSNAQTIVAEWSEDESWWSLTCANCGKPAPDPWPILGVSTNDVFCKTCFLGFFHE